MIGDVFLWMFAQAACDALNSKRLGPDWSHEYRDAQVALSFACADLNARLGTRLTWRCG